MKSIHYITLFSIFFCCNSLLAQADLQIQASRTSGVAPLFVFFDGTTSNGLAGTNDLANADFSWNFDVTNTDTDGNWEQTKGMVAGHVFEQPGTYTVSCTLLAPDGTRDTESLTITVTPFAGTTYYVSNAGNDANDGLSDATAWATANFALNQLSANESILFRRDDTFTGVDANLNNLSGGPMLIGAYGSGDAPILEAAAGQTIIALSNCHNLRVMDLHAVCTGTGNDTRALRSENTSSHILALRLEVEQAGSVAIYQDQSDLIGIFDCYVHNFGVLATFSGDNTRLAWVGNRIDSLIGTAQPEHAMRIQRGEKQFIAHNEFTNIIDTKTCITIRGDQQRHVMVYANKLDRILQVGPTSHTAVQAISHVTIEGNYIGHNSDYTGSAFDQTPNGIIIEATRIVVRNNVIDGYSRAVNIRTQNVDVDAGFVDVYNNTANWRSVSPISGTEGRMVLAQDAHDITVRNNLISAPTLAQAIIYEDFNTTGAIVSDNLATITPDYITDPLPDSAADMNDISNYQLLSTSAAIDAGANDVPVFFDQKMTVRPIGTNKDIGAFEYATDLLIEATVILQGAFDTGTSLMNDDLRTAALIPNTEPYATSGFPDLKNAGVAHTANLSITGNDAIVDWVMVELRDKNDSSTVLASRAALLQADGDVVDTDGTSVVSFIGVAPDDYFVAVRHRNHLGVMTAVAVGLN